MGPANSVVVRRLRPRLRTSRQLTPSTPVQRIRVGKNNGAQVALRPCSLLQIKQGCRLLTTSLGGGTPTCQCRRPSVFFRSHAAVTGVRTLAYAPIRRGASSQTQHLLRFPRRDLPCRLKPDSRQSYSRSRSLQSRSLRLFVAVVWRSHVRCSCSAQSHSAQSSALMLQGQST